MDHHKKPLGAAYKELKLFLNLKNKTNKNPTPTPKYRSTVSSIPFHMKTAHFFECIKCSQVIHQSLSVIRSLSNSIWDQLRVSALWPKWLTFTVNTTSLLIPRIIMSY